ncbi:MAG: hypothetical protein M5R36_28675 [Deltaproteobacteria bacterium]|nr:hypothetical protein [Deltaproteobacteria bacterium]
MKKNLTPRTVLVLGVIGVCLFFLLPNMLGKEEIKIGPSTLDSVNLGLDLRGGMHVVLRVMTQKAIVDELGNDAGRLEEALKEKNAPTDEIKVEDERRVVVTFSSEPAKTQGVAYLKEYWSRYNIDSLGPTQISMQMDPQEIDYLKQNALFQARETITNRIDEFAVKEPQIYTQGTDQIVVRLPGIVDPTRAKQLIGRTAVLEFKILDQAGYFDLSRDALLSRIGERFRRATRSTQREKRYAKAPGSTFLKRSPRSAARNWWTRGARWISTSGRR